MNAPRDPATRADCPFTSCPTPEQCVDACRHNAARPVDTTTFARSECPLGLCPTPSGCADACQHNARVVAYAAQQTKTTAAITAPPDGEGNHGDETEEPF